MSSIGSRKQTKAKPMLPKAQRPASQYRFGIGEWYGKSFVALTRKERDFYASIQALPKAERPPQSCPFLSRHGNSVSCWKPGGICSLRSYEKSRTTGLVTIDSRRSTLRAICPSRFEQEQTIYGWIGETILSDSKAIAIGETPFLKRVPLMGVGERVSEREVGRIDNVLVTAGSDPLQWCPVEKQAVYFSGERMSLEFQNILSFEGEGVPFPVKNRRPDYRSSGPKRLLPQLEIKVPTLSTWGRKMAVVVDEDFFDRLGQMKEANDISNAEVVWFVVRYVENQSGFQLQPLKTFITRLRDAVEGLVAAVPVPRSEFEKVIRLRLEKIKARS
jgi:restriction endonuclease NotI